MDPRSASPPSVQSPPTTSTGSNAVANGIPVSPISDHTAGAGHKRKRLKIAVACNGCRDKKLKCDGKRPACSTCERKGIVAHCNYDESRSKAQFSKEYVADLQKRIEDLEGMLKTKPVADSGLVRLDRPGNMTLFDRSEPSRSPRATLEDVSSGQIASRQPPPEASFDIHTPNSGYPISFVRNEPAVTPLPLQVGNSTSTSARNISAETNNHTPPNVNRDAALSPQAEEIDAMGAIIDDTEDAGEHLSPSSREVGEKDGFYGGSSVASFMNEIRSSSSGRRPTLRKPRPTLPGGTSKPHFSPLPSRIMKNPEISRNIHFPLSATPTIAEMYVLPPRALADHLMDCYWEKVHSLYPFFHKPSFMQKYETFWTRAAPGSPPISIDPQRGILYGCINTMMALGCKFSTSMTLEEREANGEIFVTRSNPLIQTEIIDIGSLELVQMMLLLGQYMQGTTAVNRCWNALGMAIRIAMGLGMHLEGNLARDPDVIRRETKRRVWHCCVIFDRILGMTLGRPCVVRKNRVSLPRELEPTSTAEEQQLDYTFHIQSIKLHSILGDILFKVYEPLTDDAGFITVNPAVFKVLNEPHCTNSIVEIDSAMLRFWESVPKDLQLESSSAVSDSVKKRQAVALRASYLHLRIFLFRPLLTILANKPSLVDESNMMHSYIFLRGSTYCLHAALELIELIYANHDTGCEPPWWYSVLYIYTSAAVLIAANHQPQRLQHYFKADTNSHDQIRDSVTKAKQILRMLQGVSRAARACLAILEGFDQHQQQQGAQQTGSAPEIAGGESERFADAGSNSREADLTASGPSTTTTALPQSSSQILIQSESNQKSSQYDSDLDHSLSHSHDNINSDNNATVIGNNGTWPFETSVGLGVGGDDFLLPSFEWLMASEDMMETDGYSGGVMWSHGGEGE